MLFLELIVLEISLIVILALRKIDSLSRLRQSLGLSEIMRKMLVG
ncbi:hypothetical protein GCM10008943_03950 [Paenochrobactrum glaciei]|uniref:Uncharacterized protein n=1 Tax=Paenochrobactrum glaciei TaxID=486407 RepID=A0ABP3QJC5_9HYPH